VQWGTTQITGGEAHIDTWNPAPVWGDSNASVLTVIHGNTNFYAQIGEDHPNTGYGGNVEIFYEYKPDSGPPLTAYPNVIPSGNVDYKVWEDGRDLGFVFQWNNTTYFGPSVTWWPTEIQSFSEIYDYQFQSGTSLGDAAMGNKSNHVYFNSVAWFDTSYGNHWANLDYSQGTPANYQILAHSNANNFSSWDNRCG
jgi:hypothetical protein